MRILVFAGNLAKGGSFQAAVSFVKAAQERYSHHEWHVIAPPDLVSQFDSVSQSVKIWPVAGRMRPAPATAVTMARLERRIDPDVVYSVFGPPWWFPRAPHVCGFAVSWMLRPRSIAWTKFSRRSAMIKRFGNLGRWLALRPGWTYIVETDDMRSSFLKKTRFRSADVRVVMNGPSIGFSGRQPNKREHPGAGRPFRFLAIAADYPHKNLEILVDVARRLRDASIDFEIGFTLADEAWGNLTRTYEADPIEQHLHNNGVVDVVDLPDLYERYDALLLPTLLEASTASYPEAMAAGIPILTSDLPFARSLCNQAAAYFDPLSSLSIADSCVDVVREQSRYEQLATAGSERLAAFPTPSQKCDATVAVLEHVGGSMS